MFGMYSPQLNYGEYKPNPTKRNSEFGIRCLVVKGLTLPTILFAGQVVKGLIPKSFSYFSASRLLSNSLSNPPNRPPQCAILRCAYWREWSQWRSNSTRYTLYPVNLSDGLLHELSKRAIANSCKSIISLLLFILIKQKTHCRIQCAFLPIRTADRHNLNNSHAISNNL